MMSIKLTSVTGISMAMVIRQKKKNGGINLSDKNFEYKKYKKKLHTEQLQGYFRCSCRSYYDALYQQGCRSGIYREGRICQYYYQLFSAFSMWAYRIDTIEELKELQKTLKDLWGQNGDEQMLQQFLIYATNTYSEALITLKWWADNVQMGTY